MKVRCLRTIRPTTGEATQSHYWLTIGQTYVVLSIETLPTGKIEYRLMANDGLTPGLFDASQFVVVDDRLPVTWVVEVGQDGALTQAPRAWIRPGFWEDFFNRDRQAVEDFETERALIMAEAAVSDAL